MNKQVIDFISKFNDNHCDKSNPIVTLFTEKCCYWFSHILTSRFPDDSEIVYAPDEFHFGARIGDRVYDITGDVTTSHDWISWEELSYHNPILEDLVTRTCIMLED